MWARPEAGSGSQASWPAAAGADYPNRTRLIVDIEHQ